MFFCNQKFAAFLVAVVFLAAATARAEKPVDFNRDIRPILSDNCFNCHGPDDQKRKAKLRLDQRDSATQLRDGNAAIVPHDIKGSQLWNRINAKDPDDIMPPPASNKKLTADQIDALKRWVLEGAQYKGHWAWEAPKKPALPEIKDKNWPKNAVDYFVAAKLEEKHLKPSSEARKEALIRRVSFDLTGLPPTPAEIDAFLADKKPGAYERVVDRLLASPHYGEQQARYWLDAVRYGDTHGLHLDNERSMWPYRDWVVKAFNENMPYDKFTLWQLAGDELPNATTEEKIASGYNRCNVSTSEGGAIDDEFYVRYAVDRTETTCAVWMGLTAGCAVCHDHKFDPLKQKEFYSLYWFFNNCTEKAMDGNAMLTPPTLKLPNPEQKKKEDELDSQIAVVNVDVTNILKKLHYKDPGPTKLETTTNSAAEVVWIDDVFPAGAKPMNMADTPEIQWITNSQGPVFSGKRAIHRAANGLAQDFFETTTAPMIVGKDDTLFAYVFLDPTNLPKAVTLQFHAPEWSYRAVWGDASLIPWGDVNTPSKMRIGDLPVAGKWVRLEVPVETFKMKPGVRITGMSFVEYGGTVTWDKAGILTKTVQKDHSADSLAAWELHSRAEDAAGLPEEIAKILNAKPKYLTDADKMKLKEYFLANIHAASREQLKPAYDRLSPIQKKRTELEDTVPGTLVMQEMEKPRGAFVLKRGQYDQKGDEVFPNVPAFLPPLPAGEPTNRVALAKWLTSTNHPLTARVIVNRYWQQYFGTGIVKTSQDFGSQGEWPSHPELLDWLACHFMESGWDVKQFHRLLVTSAAYRQDSKFTSQKLEVDPENRLVSRGPRFRLDAEEIRDNALFVSGLLSDKMGGKAVRPYQPSGIWEAVGYTSSNTSKFTQDHGEALYRRSLYTFWKRTAPPPGMVTFDAPSREKYCVRRERSDTPLQALEIMNDPQYIEAARHLGQRMIEESRSSGERLDYGFRLVTSRHPSFGEERVLKKALSNELDRYNKDKDAATQLISIGESTVNTNIPPAELAAYTTVASLLLNLDETINRN